MKKSLLFAVIAFIAAALLPVSLATAAEVDIIVLDPSFEETPALGQGAYIYLVDYTGPWMSDLGNGAFIVSSYYGGDLPAHSGSHKVHTTDPETTPIRFDHIYQILDETFVEGRTYTLRVWVENYRAGTGVVDDWGLFFTAEDYTINLAEAHGLAVLPDWEQISLEYTATAADAGRKIGIKIGAGDGLSYVAFDDVTLSSSDPGFASDPNPAIEQADVPRDVVLNWQPAELSAPTKGQIVYFGETFEGVNDATGGIAQTAPSSAPAQVLEFGKTYYWRVDAVDGATVIKGDVWTFTSEPISIPVVGITVQASSSFGDSGPEKTIDGSGLAGDLHGIFAADMWISGGLPATIEYAFDRAYKLHELWIWNSNQAIEAFVGFGGKEVVIEHSLDGENWTVLDGVGPLAQATGLAGYAHNTTIDFGGAMAQHVRVTVNSVQGIAPQASLSEVRFYAIPVYAREPQPADGAMADTVNPTLDWRAGREAEAHEVVVSQDQAAMTDGSAVAVVTQESSYRPDTLLYGETYYWQVTETGADGSDPRYQGRVWSFMAPDTLAIDDFESYANKEFLEIWATWIDGFEDPSNGATVGNGNEGEKSIVHEGRQSMPIKYDNRGAPISAVTRSFTPALDWTVGAPASLSLYIRGMGVGREQPANEGQPIYAVITDSSGQSAALSYKEGDATATLSFVFEAWVIPLADLATLDISRIKSITIGVGTPGGSPSGATGTIYVDLLAVGVSPAVPAPGTQPTVRTAKASYSPNEPIVFHFTNADDVSAVDWVGFMIAGNPSDTFIDFIFLDHVTDGSVTYDAGLPPGSYDVRLYWDDSYNIEASNVFIVE